MTRADMIGKVELMLLAALPEAELDAVLAELAAAVPHARISDLIYHPDIPRTAEQIVDEALFRDRMGLAGSARRA
ncbi:MULTISPECIES: hypothetical protein [Rhodomicrobium]|uniref:hypothetical protein n=1 Tax=Rhodomicrobium TaxID=1068 RepID=UPI000B4C0939|nr:MULTISPECIES: hypothetical protein [Rhodomicrobium]